MADSMMDNEASGTVIDTDVTPTAFTDAPIAESVPVAAVNGERRDRAANHGAGGRWAPGNTERVTHGDRSVARQQARAAARQERLDAIVKARRITDPVQLLIAELLVDACQRARDAFEYGEAQGAPGPIAARGSRRSSEMVSQQRTDQASRLAQQLGLQTTGAPPRSIADLLREDG